MGPADPEINERQNCHTTDRYFFIIFPDCLCVGDMFVTGISESYDDACYDKDILGNYLSEDDFRYCVT